MRNRTATADGSETTGTDASKAVDGDDTTRWASPAATGSHWLKLDYGSYYHFTEYILHQPKDRLMWGAGRILHHENLYGIVKRLRKLESRQAEHGQIPDLEEEIRRLQAAQRRQRAYRIACSMPSIDFLHASK